MRLALYDSVTGYYARNPAPIGPPRDYYTSPELHPAFAALLSRQVDQLWLALDKPSPFVVHEAGPGSGLFARDLLSWARSALPDLYAALAYRLDETSVVLRQRQLDLLIEAGHGEHVSWVRGFELTPAPHLIVANELLDALPFHLAQVRDARLEELYVTLDRGDFELQPGPPSTPALETYFARLGLLPGEGCRAEVNLAALEWLRSAAESIATGMLIVLDYGYPAEQLYHHSRRYGSLLCYHQHTLNSDPLSRAGDQDITAHVDFTSLRWAGETAGLATLGLVSQHTLLKNLGWAELRARVSSAPIAQAEREANLRALDALIDPSGLGRILMLAQQRGLDGFVPIVLAGGPSVDRIHLPMRAAEHILLPQAADAEGLLDFESQWAEFWSGER